MANALSRLTSFVRSWLRRSRMEREMDHEMRFHIDARAADLHAHGLAPAEAQRRAREEFGDVIRWKEAGRDARGLTLVDDLAADLRFAGRMMRQSPGFTLAAVLSLACGIGATTGIFGLFDLLLLKPLPVRDAHELVHVTTAGTAGDATSGSANYPWFQAVASRTDLFADAMLLRDDLYKVTIDGRVEPLMGQRVTTNYHRLLGVPVILGRTLTADDRPEAGAPPVAVISHRLWQQRFGGRNDVIGAAIAVDQEPYTIVGVTGPGFDGILVGWTADVTIPLDTSQFMQRGNWSTMPLIARLKPGVEIDEAQRQLDPMLARFVAAGTTDARAQRFRSRYLQRTSVASAETGISDLRERFSTPIQLLMIAVVLLLLVACVNLAGLLVARNATRQHEIGMRLALGARRGRIVRQLLTESAALALLGSALGLVLAVRGGNALIAMMPPQFGPLSLALVPDARVLTFALAATVATTLLAGLLPAWQACRVRVLPSPHGTPRATTASPRVGRALVVAQLALSLVLVAGAVLCVRSLLNLGRVDTGFDRSRLLVVMIDPQGSSYEGEQLRVFQRETLAALGAVPGVGQATLATGSPFNGNIDGKRLSVPGVPPREADDAIIQTNLVGPGYFDALQIPVLGRAIDEGDREKTQRVAVVSETFARRYFGDAAAAVGRTFEIGLQGILTPHEIVGVARETRYQSLRAPSERLVYLPWFQADDVRSTSFEFVVRTDGPPENWIEPVRAALQQVRRDVPILAIQPMTAVINGRLMSERLLAILGTFFAAGALMLAAMGVYGLLAHLVARRVPEIGVRLALGAQPVEIVWMTLRENLLLAAGGAAIGIVGAVVGLRVLEELLFGLTPTDTVNLLLAAAILVLVSLGAAIVPARRAAAVDPLVALRSE